MRISVCETGGVGWKNGGREEVGRAHVREEKEVSWGNEEMIG